MFWGQVFFLYDRSNSNPACLWLLAICFLLSDHKCTRAFLNANDFLKFVNVFESIIVLILELLQSLRSRLQAIFSDQQWLATQASVAIFVWEVRWLIVRKLSLSLSRCLFTENYATHVKYGLIFVLVCAVQGVTNMDSNCTRALI